MYMYMSICTKFRGMCPSSWLLFLKMSPAQVLPTCSPRKRADYTLQTSNVYIIANAGSINPAWIVMSFGI